MFRRDIPLYGFNSVKTEFSTPLREQAPPDFKKSILLGKHPVLPDVKFIKWIEIFS